MTRYNEKDDEKDFASGQEPKVVENGDKYDDCYGVDYVKLTDEHIKALQEGKALYIDIACGEYCCLIKKM